MAALIAVSGLSKVFARAQRNPGLRGAFQHLLHPSTTSTAAVDDISFDIDSGESVAYVGPNGAGKSTTIKLLTGILVPTAGRVTVCGIAPSQRRVENAKNISVVFGQRTQLWWDIPVQESFRLLGEIYEVDAADFRRSLAELVDVLELRELMDIPARQLSLGQRMRCDLAAAVIHQPRVLYLDEPTIGLDVSVKARFRTFIKTLRDDRGLTVVLTSHDLGDIEELCPRLMMIDRGKIIYDGALAQLTRRFGREQRLALTLTRRVTDADQHEVGVALGRRAVRMDQSTDAVLGVWFDSSEVTAAEVLRMLPVSLPVADIDIERTSTESIVRQLYEGHLVLPADDQRGSDRAHG